MCSIIKNHNNKILKKNVIQEPEQKKCNCRITDQCPLNGKCLTTCLVYKADVITDDDQRQYTGLTEETFKQWYYNHQLSLRDRKYSNSTELSKYAWKLKESNKVHNINWSIHRRAAVYTNKSKRCNLCLAEKLAITRTDKSESLNKKSELVSKCRHENIFYLRAISRQL